MEKDKGIGTGYLVSKEGKEPAPDVVGAATSSNAVLIVNLPAAPPTLSSPKLGGHTFSVSVRTTEGSNHHFEFTESLGKPNWTELICRLARAVT